MQELLQFGSAPRRVPASLQIVNLFNGFGQVGWAIFGFGMIFFWAFVATSDVSFITFRGEHPTVTGKVSDVEETSASVNKRHVIAAHYEYSVAGSALSGTSYSTGQSVSAGETVTVEYDPSDPSKSRIAGMRRAQFPPGTLFVSILPLIGFAFLIGSILTGLKRNRLLRDGILAQGKLTAKNPTNITVNHRTVYELVFEFTARDGRRCEAKVNTSITERLEDEALEPLLYDPADPMRAYLLDNAPARPELELNGELRGNSTRAMYALILAALVLAANAAIAYFKFR